MFAIHRIKKSYIIAVGVASLLFVTLIVKGLFFSMPSSITCNTVKNVRIVIDDSFTVADFLKQFDLQVDISTEEKVSINIPAEFNDVYENYNTIQQKQGFNLVNYKGEAATRYTYSIDNYPTEAQIKANVIICNNRVIAGDLCTVTFGGSMSTLDDKTIEG